MAALADPDFALHPGIDAAALTIAYRATGRISIEPFLTETAAAALRDHLVARKDWMLVMNAGEKVYEMPRTAAAALTADQRATLDRKIGESALHDFQYRYESIRVADDPGVRGATLLERFAAFLSSPQVIELLRGVTGAPVEFADAQATAYGPGHFLTRHDDDVEGKGRHAAYVLGLTPGWRAEWGGLLLFHRGERDIDHGFAPAFNALRLFAVPAVHSVSHVWPYVPEPRLSVTGWLRSHAATARP
ncbi:2OG-Fe(II) oxygenase [Sphingomonas sp. BT-65]|uniref:2OG-Fe(II) oxygenase n=1 Tax=Sphingomonas sp. BT-65 TaxID=2989821 RepID=UPI0022354AA8|nr:2OG-Fe(II) oxygenase family protein [Sphingomonas sp. BT-65]MCW4461707.1 2OG-Fe(II) oxygenase [Sphingomonas sp. BT-65]